MRLFAHELRKKIWSKLFGITGNVRPATELKQAIDQPGSPDSWKLIRRRAQTNAALYEAAFPFVPRNKVQSEDDKPTAASVLPTWRDNPQIKDVGGELTSNLPYQEQFWTKKADVSLEALKGLQDVKGYITALPIEWTENENLRIPYPTALIVHNDQQRRQGDVTPQFVQIDRPSNAPASVG